MEGKLINQTNITTMFVCWFAEGIRVCHTVWNKFITIAKMNKYGYRSQAKLIKPSVDHNAHPSSSDHLPMLSAKQLTPSRPPLLSHRKHQPLLSTPMIEKSKKNLLLMRKINPLNRPHSRSSSSESSRIMKRLDSGKEVKHLPQLMILKPNLDKRTYLRQPLVRQSLVGEEAIQKFYQRYKQIDKRKEKQAFLNQKHALTNIIALLQMHNFTPRKLTVVKLKGEDAILDLKKLGLGQGSMGPVVTEIVNYLQKFEEVDLSYNRIDALLGQSLIQKLGKVKKIDLSHNRIGKMGCQKIAEMFLLSGTRIQQLNLEQNNLLDNAGVILIEHVLRFNNLKKLNVNKNFMGTKFASKLKEVLLSDRQLHELYLSWNQFNSKAVKAILEGVAEHSDLRIFDFSWNKIQSQNVEILAKIFSQAQNLLHADFSFCELGLSSIPILSQALHDNHSLYGLHFQGNSGFIDHRGFLNSTEREYSEYPLPIIKGIIRRIDGVKPNPINEFKGGNMRDVCWICHSWQEKYFDFLYTKDMQEEAKQCSAKVIECYIHLRHENYTAVKMFLSDEGDRFEVSRMCPIGNLQYFFTFYLGNDRRKVMINRQIQSMFEQLPLKYYIGKIQISETITARNNSSCDYECDPLDETYQANIRLLPRSAQVGVMFIL